MNHINLKTREADPRSRHYRFGLYSQFRFNKRDYQIRKNLEFSAVKIFPKKDIPIISRELAKNSITEYLVVSCSKMLFSPNGESDSDFLYLPFGRSLDCILR